MKNPMPGRGLRGFTLIEMLVVMAVMLALVAIGIPSLQNALHQSKMRGMVQEITSRCGWRASTRSRRRPWDRADRPVDRPRQTRPRASVLGP